MGKRAAVSQKIVKAKAIKTAACEESTLAPVDVEPRVDVSSVLKALTAAMAENCIDAVSAEMLGAAAPFALATPTEKRHRFEADTVTMISDAIDSAVDSCRNAAGVAETTLQEHKDGVDKLTAMLEELKRDAEAGESEKESCAAAARDARKALTNASQSLASEQKREEAEVGKRESVRKEKIEYEEARAGLWQKLKDNEFGSKWQERNKCITWIIQLLQRAGAARIPPSLAAALGPVLKTKAVDRGAFALQVLEHAEQHWSDSVAGLESTIADIGLAIDGCASDVAAAQDAIVVAEANNKRAEDEAMEAANSWCGKATRVYELGEELKTASRKGTTFEESLTHARIRLSALEELRSQFVALRDLSEETPEEMQDPGESTCDGGSIANMDMELAPASAGNALIDAEGKAAAAAEPLDREAMEVVVAQAGGA